MKIKLFLLSIFSCITLAACGQGSSTSSDARGKQSNFVGSQTIVLDNNGNTASEVDDLVLTINGDVITIVDEDFSSTSQLSADNRFSLSSPLFSTSSGGITCTGSVNYSGQLIADEISGSISGEFNCSGTIFDVTGSFSTTR